jgi:hypothetical protein
MERAKFFVERRRQDLLAADEELAGALDRVGQAVDRGAVIFCHPRGNPNAASFLGFLELFPDYREVFANLAKIRFYFLDRSCLIFHFFLHPACSITDGERLNHHRGQCRQDEPADPFLKGNDEINSSLKGEKFLLDIINSRIE